MWSVWKTKILQEKQTHAILRWFQSCLIVHEDLHNKQEKKKTECKFESAKFLFQPLQNIIEIIYNSELQETIEAHLEKKLALFSL